METQILPSPQKGGKAAPNFLPMSILAKRLDGSGYHWYGGIGLGPRDIVLDGDLAPPTERGTAAPTFWPTLLWHGRPSQQLLSSCYGRPME